MDSSRQKRPRTGLELLLDTLSDATTSLYSSTERELARPRASDIRPPNGHHNHGIVHPQTDEDRRFFELAQEALEATGRAVDPTIQDLLRRLQYALLPHGNPIRDGQTLRTLPQGRVDIHGFYERFPNMSNDIFVPTPDDWAQDRESGPSSTRDLHKNARYLAARTGPVHPRSRERSKGDAFNDLLGNANEKAPFSPLVTLRGSIDGTRARALSIEGNELGQNEMLWGDEYDESNTRHYACIKCPMTFRRLLDLKRHEKQHLPVLPNICDLCGKGFARKDALKRHRGTLTCQRNSATREFGESGD